jgi:hypothetical protein
MFCALLIQASKAGLLPSLMGKFQALTALDERTLYEEVAHVQRNG